MLVSAPCMLPGVDSSGELDLSSGVSLLNPASCSLIFKSSYSLLRSPLRLLQLTFDSFLTMYVM